MLFISIGDVAFLCLYTRSLNFVMNVDMLSFFISIVIVGDHAMYCFIRVGGVFIQLFCKILNVIIIVDILKLYVFI